MSSPHYHNDYPTAEERTARAIKEARDAAERNAQEFLGRNAAILALLPGRRIDVIRNEGDLAGTEVEALRNQQTSYSFGPGLSLYITSAGATNLRTLAESPDGEHVTAYANLIRKADSEGTHHRLYLPRGIFNASFGGVQIYGKSEWEQGRSTAVGCSDPFGLAYAEVVRIEGDHNEVWQNRYFTPDGEPV